MSVPDDDEDTPTPGDDGGDDETGDAGTGAGDGTNGDETGAGETEATEPSYSLEASDLNYDLTELSAGEPGGLDEAYVDQHYSTSPDLVLLENGEEIPLDELSELYIENENGELLGTIDEKIPEYNVENGEKLYVTAKIDNTNLSQEITVKKDLPEHYFREIWVDGSREPWLNWIENITGNRPEPYETPFKFDTQDFTFEEFYQQRIETVESYERGEIEDSVPSADQLDFEGLSKQEKIALASKHTNDTIEGRSGTAPIKAIAIEQILRKYTDLNEPIAAGGFHNPADRTEGLSGSHGSQMIHVDGDNYHSETLNMLRNDQAVHVDNIEDIALNSTTGNIGRYISIVGELDPKMEEVRFRTGINSLNNMIRSFTFPPRPTERFHSVHDYNTALKVRDLIVENKFEEALLGEMTGTIHHIDTGRYNTLVQDGNTVRAISSSGSRLNHDILEDYRKPKKI